MTKHDPARAELILAHIVQGIETTGTAPTVRELMVSVGLSSPSAVQHHIRRLEAAGYLYRVHNRACPCGLRLTDKVPLE